MSPNLTTDDTVGVDSDLVDVGFRLWRGVLAAIVIGVVVGALLGALAAHFGSTSYQATTSLSVLPDPVLNTAQSGTSDTVSQDATAFIQSELVVLNGAQLADQVRADLKLGFSPDVQSTQLGESYVVQVTASGPTSGDARRIATVTARDYSRLRSRQLTAEVRTAQASTTRQVSAVLTQLDAARKNTRANAAPTPSQTALQTEYEQLLSVRGQLANTPVAAGSVVRVLTSARSDTPTLSSAEKDALTGALIGALLALVVLAFLRRSVPRVNGVGDLVSVGAPTLLPALPAASYRALRSGTVWDSRDARLLAARLRPEVVAAGSLLVVAGTDASSGGRDVAAALAANLVDRRPVLLVSEAVHVTPPVAADLVDAWIVADDLSELDVTGGGDHAAGREPVDGPSADRDVHVSASDGPVALPSTAHGVWLLAQPEADGTRPGGDVRARTVGELLLTAVSAGWLVVLDAPSIAESGLAVDCLDDTGVLALVAGRGRTRPGDLAGALDICNARGIPLAGVVLNDGGGVVERLVRRVTGRGSLPSPAEQGSPVALSSPPWRSPARPVNQPGQHRPSPSANGRLLGHATRVRR